MFLLSINNLFHSNLISLLRIPIPQYIVKAESVNVVGPYVYRFKYFQYVYGPFQ